MKHMKNAIVYYFQIQNFLNVIKSFLKGFQDIFETFVDVFESFFSETYVTFAVHFLAPISVLSAKAARQPGQ